MIKKILLITGFVFLLTGCGGQRADILSGTTKRPGIPKVKRPGIPSQNLKASALDSANEMRDLLSEIDKEIDRPNITEEDIRRGWYIGGEGDRKYGTPDGWIWKAAGKNSKWMSPNILTEIDHSKSESLCKKTAGRYIISCIDTESEDCEYVSETKCECIEGSKWKDDQGCIMLKDGDFIEIEKEDLIRGWYQGLINEKKLNTPSNWIWQEAGQKSRWQNSSHR